MTSAPELAETKAAALLFCLQRAQVEVGEAKAAEAAQQRLAEEATAKAEGLRAVIAGSGTQNMQRVVQLEAEVGELHRRHGRERGIRIIWADVANKWENLHRAEQGRAHSLRDHYDRPRASLDSCAAKSYSRLGLLIRDARAWAAL